MDTKQEGCTPKDPQVSLREELKSERVQDPVTAGPVLRIQLKSERVQEPLFSSGEAGAAFAYELAVNQPQPVTIELIEPQIAIIFHGRADSGHVNNPAEAG